MKKGLRYEMSEEMTRDPDFRIHIKTTEDLTYSGLSLPNIFTMFFVTSLVTFLHIALVLSSNLVFLSAQQLYIRYPGGDWIIPGSTLDITGDSNLPTLPMGLTLKHPLKKAPRSPKSAAQT